MIKAKRRVKKIAKKKPGDDLINTPLEFWRLIQQKGGLKINDNLYVEVKI